MRTTTRTNRGSLLATLLAVAGLVLGCSKATTSNVAVGEVQMGEGGEVLNKDYIIKDRTLSKEIEVFDVKARYVGEYLEGQAILRNKKKNTVEYEYKFEWYDAEGFPVESNVTLWTPDLLYGKEQKWIKGLCPKAGATGFKILIRGPNPIEE